MQRLLNQKSLLVVSLGSIIYLFLSCNDQPSRSTSSTSTSATTAFKSADATAASNLQLDAKKPLSIFTLLTHGKYSSECSVDYNLRRSWITSFEITKNSIEQHTKTFANTYCQNPDESVLFSIVPQELQTTYLTDVYLFKFKISRIDLTAYSKENIKKLNSSEFGGYRNWTINETKELYPEILTDQEKKRLKIGESNYFHIRIEDKDFSLTTNIEDFYNLQKVLQYKYQQED